MNIDAEKLENLAKQFKRDIDRGPYCSCRAAIGKVGKVTFLLVALDEGEAFHEKITPSVLQNQVISK